jgi:nitroreductase
VVGLAPVEEALWREAVAVAINAPSVRNVQPWRFVLRGDALALHMSEDALGGTCDAALRTVSISCGVVLHHLCVALRAAGATPLIELASDPGATGLLATVRLGERRPPTGDETLRANAILSSHTQRAMFDGRALRGEFLDRLALVVADQGGFLDVLRDDRRVAAYELIAEADRALARQAPVLAVLSSTADGLRDQLDAGQALSALLLEAALEGCWAGYLDAPLRDAGARARLRGLVSRGDVPMLLLRFGHAAAAPRAGRRPLDDVLELASAEQTTTEEHP